MKRAIKIAVRISSLLLLGVLVFFVSVFSKSSPKNENSQDQNNKEKDLFSAFSVPYAYADATSGGGCNLNDLCQNCSGDSSDGGGGSGSGGAGGSGT